MPGMQSAFIDIGGERTAFLHVADVWQPPPEGSALPAHRNPSAPQKPIEKLIFEEQSLMMQVIRQIHALTSTLGQPKVEAMRQRIALIHPGCEVHCVEDFAAPGNWPALLPAAVDGVIDACDQVHAKQALAAWALKTRALFITCGAAGGKRQGERVEIADLAEVTHDPLMAALRARLRQTGSMAKGGKDGKDRQARSGLHVVFSREAVTRPAACGPQPGHDRNLNCHGYGSAVTVTATFGLVTTSWMLERLAQGRTLQHPHT